MSAAFPSYAEDERLETEMNQMLALGEKVGNLKEKLSALTGDKADRAKETLDIYVVWFSTQPCKLLNVVLLLPHAWLSEVDHQAD